MKELDFLPAAYREKNAAKKGRLCQIAMVLTFGAIVTLAASLQFALYRSAKAELASVAAQHEDAIAKAAQLAALRAEVDQQRQFCDLYTYLKYPWPRTQMLAEIARNLPPQVTLRELTIVEETPEGGAPKGVIAVDLAKQQAADERPAKLDLESLRRQRDHSRPEIQLSGTTTDSGALHLFVMTLNGTPLFESAKLHSMETVAGGKQAQSNFFVRLTARAGYGQPGGPQSPPAVAAQGNAAVASQDNAAVAAQGNSARSPDRS